MSYQSEDIIEEQYDNTGFDEAYDLVEKSYNNMMEIVNNSNNTGLLYSCAVSNLFDLLTTENYEMPKKYKKEKDIYIMDPILIDPDEDLENKKTEKWIVCRSHKQQEEYDKKYQRWLNKNKEKIEEKKQKQIEEQKQIELQEKAKANKFNWTLPAELRGIVKPKPQKPKISKTQRRRNRRKKTTTTKIASQGSEPFGVHTRW